MSEKDSEKTAKNGEFSEESLREIAVEIVKRRLALKIHWTAYLIVNIGLFIINITVDDSYMWVWWPITGWGIAVLTHSFNYVSYRRGLFNSARTTLLWYHIFFAILISAFLHFIDNFTGSTTSHWWYWPVIPILLSAIVNIITYYVFKPKKNEDTRKSYIDRKVDREMKKLGI
ncbi:MAG: hypothetical protein GF364_18025 [Candidatus Lokiarchaeota archaeon]|nr:hypothetical protein [Candidatus Lokiarchaeota archaeon]